jgi:hypothetical protein
MEEIEKISDGDDDDLVVEAIWSIYLMIKIWQVYFLLY